MWIIPTERRFALKGSAAEVRYEKPDSVEQGMPALSNQKCFSEVQTKTIKWTRKVSHLRRMQPFLNVVCIKKAASMGG